MSHRSSLEAPPPRTLRGGAAPSSVDGDHPLQFQTHTVEIECENTTKGTSDVGALNIQSAKRKRPTECTDAKVSKSAASKSAARAAAEAQVLLQEKEVLDECVQTLLNAGWVQSRPFIPSARYIHDYGAKICKDTKTRPVRSRFKKKLEFSYDAARELVAEVLFRTECINGSAALHLTEPYGKCGYLVLQATAAVDAITPPTVADDVRDPSCAWGGGGTGDDICGLRALLSRAGMLRLVTDVHRLMRQPPPHGIAPPNSALAFDGVAEVCFEDWNTLVRLLPQDVEDEDPVTPTADDSDATDPDRIDMTSATHQLLQLTNDFGLCASLTISKCTQLSVTCPHVPPRLSEASNHARLFAWAALLLSSYPCPMLFAAEAALNIMTRDVASEEMCEELVLASILHHDALMRGDSVYMLCVVVSFSTSAQNAGYQVLARSLRMPRTRDEYHAAMVSGGFGAPFIAPMKSSSLVDIFDHIRQSTLNPLSLLSALSSLLSVLMSHGMVR